MTTEYPASWIKSQERSGGLPFRITEGLMCTVDSYPVVRTPWNTSPLVSKKEGQIRLQNKCMMCRAANYRRKRDVDPEWHKSVKKRRLDQLKTEKGALRLLASDARKIDRKMIRKRDMAYAAGTSPTIDELVAYIDALLEEQKGLCASCMKPVIVGGDKGPRKASLDRIDNDRLHEPGNMRITCQFCNYARNTLTIE